MLHLLSNPSCRREVGASWTGVAVTLVAGLGGPAAEVAGLVARPLPLGELARVVAQLGCDRGLHQHVPLRVESRLSEVSMSLWIRLCNHSYIHTYMHTHIHQRAVAGPHPTQRAQLLLCVHASSET